MSGASIPVSEHRKIARSAAMKELVTQVAAEIAKKANAEAGITDGFVSESPVTPEPDVTVDRRTARAHVWAKTGEAIHAEIKNGILMGIAASDGARR